MITDETLHKLIKIKRDEKVDFENLSIFEKKKIILFYMIEFDLYERLRMEYEKKNIDELEWIQWHLGLEKINSPLLREAFEQCEHVFDMEQMSFLKDTLIDKKITCKICGDKSQKSFEELVIHHKSNHI